MLLEVSYEVLNAQAKSRVFLPAACINRNLFLRNEKNNAKEFNMAQSNMRVGEEVSIKACLSTQWYQACLSVYLEGQGNRALRSGYYLEVAELCTR